MIEGYAVGTTHSGEWLTIPGSHYNGARDVRATEAEAWEAAAWWLDRLITDRPPLCAKVCKVGPHFRIVN